MATMNALTQSIKERITERIKLKLNQKGKEVLLFLLMENQERRKDEASRIESPQVLK